MKPITKAQAIKAIRDAINRTPDAVNPSDGLPIGLGGCVYHKGRGANIKRCLIGQVGFDLGLPTPDAEATSVTGLCIDDGFTGKAIWAERFTPAAVLLMDTAQQFADGAGNEFTPRPWREVRSVLR
jgi:hypothetical protein